MACRRSREYTLIPVASEGAPPRWTALAAARRHTAGRAAFHVDGRRVGSVAHAHLDVLRAWPQWIALDAHGVHLLVGPRQRSRALATINARLRELGLIRAWRNELFGLIDPGNGATLATFERASARFWGTPTLGAHCNGYVVDRDGRPSHLWIARRSLHKATDPGLLDNLIGGGVPHGQTPLQTVLREGWEEAGLSRSEMRRARRGRVIQVDSDVPEGRMVEQIHVFDLELPHGLVPRNQDGEVSEIRLLDVAKVAECAANGAMTVDATLVTLDFLLRSRLLPEAEHAALAPRLQALLGPATDQS